MPRSKGRSSKDKRRPYVPPAPPKKGPKRKESPKWYGFLVVGLMILGIIVIVLNYMNLMFGPYSPLWLFGGFGMIGVGFLLATRLR